MKPTETTPLMPLHYSVGSMTLYTRNGVQVLRKRKNSRQSQCKGTLEQVCQRIKMANCINLWRAFDGPLRPSFADRKPGQSNYNCFMHCNLKRCDRYLPKTMCEQGGCVPFEMQLTGGTLPAIGLSPADGLLVSSLAVDDLSIDGTTTLGDIWEAVVRSNRGFYHSGLMGFFFLVRHQSLIPRTLVFTAQFAMRRHDDSVTIGLNNIALPLPRFFAVSKRDGVRYLAFRPLDGTQAEYDGLAVFQSQGERLCSPCFAAFIHPSNAFASHEEMLQAVESYGGTAREEYLTPEADHSDLESDFINNK